jgi:hypothetical protein
MQNLQADPNKLVQFADLDFKFEALLCLDAFMICPFTHEPFKVSIDIQKKQDVIKILQGQILFQEIDLRNANIAFQTI